MFFKRLAAYTIDTFIISIIISIVTFSFSYDKLNKIENNMIKVSDSYTEGKIDTEEYLSKYKDYMYDYQNSSKIISGITIVLYIGYFIVFQYLNKGQTIGKKIMKIKIVNKDKKELSLKSIIIRSLLITEIIPMIFGVLLLPLLSKGIYSFVYLLLAALLEIFMIITAMFIIYRQDHLSLHDMIAKTNVVDIK